MTPAVLARLQDALRDLEVRTRPMPPDLEAALADRWRDLPDHVKQPNQLLGTRTAGCEGTHGVFPRCNLACTPCYHAKEANRVRTDGEHTVREVDRQMGLLRARRGPGQHAQLIGGEVTLLEPDDHAETLLVMRRHGRKPMSMTHGDFDYGYLERLVLDERGERRLDFVAFAGHFDSMMFGRRGIKRARSEEELHPYRRRFVEMFERLRREHGVRYHLAHNMTVTPRNLGQVAQVVRDCHDMGFGMFSFQPAAFVGNRARWKDEYRAFGMDDVWAEVERGIGTRLPWQGAQMGDPRCNRSAYGALVGDRWIPFLDDREPGDLAMRDAFLRTFGGMDFDEDPRWVAARVARGLAAHPATAAEAARFAARLAARAGLVPLARHGARKLTFVVHAFMDAKVVKPAWAAMQEGVVAEDPDVRAAQERLGACSYAMAHPDTGELVPACVQHSVLDPLENARLAELLPVAPVGATG